MISNFDDWQRGSNPDEFLLEMDGTSEKNSEKKDLSSYEETKITTQDFNALTINLTQHDASITKQKLLLNQIQNQSAWTWWCDHVFNIYNTLVQDNFIQRLSERIHICLFQLSNQYHFQVDEAIVKNNRHVFVNELKWLTKKHKEAFITWSSKDSMDNQTRKDYLLWLNQTSKNDIIPRFRSNSKTQQQAYQYSTQKLKESVTLRGAKQLSKILQQECREMMEMAVQLSDDSYIDCDCFFLKHWNKISADLLLLCDSQLGDWDQSLKLITTELSSLKPNHLLGSDDKNSLLYKTRYSLYVWVSKASIWINELKEKNEINNDWIISWEESIQSLFYLFDNEHATKHDNIFDIDSNAKWFGSHNSKQLKKIILLLSFSVHDCIAQIDGLGLIDSDLERSSTMLIQCQKELVKIATTNRKCLDAESKVDEKYKWKVIVGFESLCGELIQIQNNTFETFKSISQKLSKNRSIHLEEIGKTKEQVKLQWSRKSELYLQQKQQQWLGMKQYGDHSADNMKELERIREQIYAQAAELINSNEYIKLLEWLATMEFTNKKLF